VSTLAYCLGAPEGSAVKNAGNAQQGKVMENLIGSKGSTEAGDVLEWSLHVVVNLVLRKTRRGV
jgi:hypothetical protein